MNYRRERYRKNIKNKEVFVFIFSLVIVFIFSMAISSNLARIIYKNTVHVGTEIKSFENSNTANTLNVDDEHLYKISDGNIVIFQGGVFANLDNAEEFKAKINGKTLTSIVNDGKHEKILLGVSDNSNFSKMIDIFKHNDIQFVKQIYNIPLDIPYATEIIRIIEKFSSFVINNYGSLFGEKITVSNFKDGIKSIEAEYGKVGLHNEFKNLKELILEFEDDVYIEELEGVLDFLYNNLKEYKI